VTPGDVVLVRFPFTDLAATKKRPALLLARVGRTARNQIATVAMITSQIESLAVEGDVRLSDREDAGLLHASVLRLAKVATIDAELVEKTIGRLSRRDLAAAKAAFRHVFSAWL
jgi:mRNA interferase MazF